MTTIEHYFLSLFPCHLKSGIPILGAWQRSGSGKGDRIPLQITKKAEDCSILSNLEYELIMVIKAVWERHCPPVEEKLHCLIPAPKGYVTPFPWPKSRDYVPFANAPHKSLTVEKAVQNWVQYEGNLLRFPGGGTQFPHGADAYIDQLASVIPMVASWGAYLFKKNVIVMSFAPRDSHEAQVQFALESGVPAVIGVLGTIKLPFPSRAFDMAHCSRCLIPWAANGGLYMMEVDRVLRPGVYWILSGPPINWWTNYQAWQRPKEELEEEQRIIEEIAELLCWEKKYEKGEIAIWRKRVNYEYCSERDSRVTLCDHSNSENVWQLLAPYNVFHPNISVLKWIINEDFLLLCCFIQWVHKAEDNKLWKKHVKAYKRVNKLLDTRRYQNILDMNSGLGSFAAALESSKQRVMNVMPTIAESDTLGVLYDRGLIGIYHDWCEAFSTYPQTYDLIHANGVFSLFKDKCSAEDILLEIDRILRPEGAVIFRDHAEILGQVKRIAAGMRWKTKMVDHEDGPLIPEKVRKVLRSLMPRWLFIKELHFDLFL
ncbi:hypothetical protein RND71_017460 [Anisodus tanguticus]|uniref:Methyltransferase n=1 Tax=Anisodus tanguticus TaxID=243964 RepID=A0AAE1S0L4_9SOLA|nr:hypothetical protein RND71_017460 [Anisodus tanguticus]